MNEETPLETSEARELMVQGAEPFDADVFEQRVQSRTRTAKIAAVALATLVIGGGALVPIGGAVIASAEVAPESRIKRIAHPTGGVISEIYVADGDEVGFFPPMTGG